MEQIDGRIHEGLNVQVTPEERDQEYEHIARSSGKHKLRGNSLLPLKLR
jgi:hypothetical protein